MFRRRRMGADRTARAQTWPPGSRDQMPWSVSAEIP